MQDAIEQDQVIQTAEDLEKNLKDSAAKEQLYTIALFDILGFSNYVEENGMDKILELYQKLMSIIYQRQSSMEGESLVTGVVPVPVSGDWKQNQWFAQGNGFINVAHFSDTFIIYMNYEFTAPRYMLRDSFYEPHPLLIGEKDAQINIAFFEKHHIYISFLKTCMDFFCHAVTLGIPLRGCISTGPAIMDSFRSIYIGQALVEAAKGETAQNALGFGFGKSFSNYHPFYNDYFIPYSAHIKKITNNSRFLSPMMPDWARYWRSSPEYNEVDLSSCILKMSSKPEFSSYYENAVRFIEFSREHENWSEEVNCEGLTDIEEYYKKAEDWLQF